jgi:hypothetical protein
MCNSTGRDSTMKKDLLRLTILVLIGLFSRLVTHEWNLTAIGAISILAGLLISHKYLKFAVPVVSMLLSDIFIGFHNTMAFVYLGFVLMTLLSTQFKDSKSFQKLFLAPFASSLVFFFISNFGVWFMGTGTANSYPPNISGLMQCFMMGVPFYRTQFLADMMLTPVLFLAFSYLPVHFLNFNFLTARKRA